MARSHPKPGPRPGTGPRTRRAESVEAEEPEPELEDGYRIGPVDVTDLVVEDLDSLDPYDRAFVPEDDPHWEIGIAEVQLWEAIVDELQSGGNVLIVGPTGCGKSGAVKKLAATLGRPLRQVPINGETRTSDFIGSVKAVFDPESESTVTRFVPGILPDALSRRHWMLLDEIDSAPPGVLFNLHGVLEVNGVLAVPGERRIWERERPFGVVATANTLGHGDDTGLYAGTGVLNEAFLDRFGAVIEAGYPDSETEVRILTGRTGIDVPLATKFVEVATKVRGEADKVSCTLSTRRLVKWAEKTVTFEDARRAFGIVITNRLAAHDRKFVEGVTQRVMGWIR
jgi:cobaltochelatase CobS